jgi:hypothetical protein
MSVVRRATVRRWACVLSGVLLLVAVPPALAARPVAEVADVRTDELSARIRSSDGVAHAGLVEIRGSIGLPNLPRLTSVSRLLSGTTRARVWWAGPQHWRVATLTPTGERDLVPHRNGAALWDSDTGTSRLLYGFPAVRLPRADDLLPPQAARRLLAALGPAERFERIPARRVAGRAAAGLRVVPADPRSSITAVDLWVDPPSGLPLALELRTAGVAAPVLATRFLDLRLGVPPAAAVSSARAPQARSHRYGGGDLASSVDRYAPWRLPPRLADLPRTRAPGSLGGVATYGEGLTRFVVLPLPGDVAGEAIRRGRTITAPLEVAGGEALPLDRPPLRIVLARGADYAHAYLLAGTVRPEVLNAAVTELFAHPPEHR